MEPDACRGRQSSRLGPRSPIPGRPVPPSGIVPLPLPEFLRLSSAGRGGAGRVPRSKTRYMASCRPEHIVLSPTLSGAAIVPADPAARNRPIDAWVYLSPEQTGRLHRPVDARSDLYALGMILYELAVGMRPFKATDALEWAHSHLARSPRPPISVIPSFPTIVSDMILKLLAKEPESRYQTARGLQRDLERCLGQWEEAARDHGISAR